MPVAGGVHAWTPPYYVKHTKEDLTTENVEKFFSLTKHTLNATLDLFKKVSKK